ncbi:hypothetical protein PSPO01_11215 [Paraphaeosphaeria sporulosa]
MVDDDAFEVFDDRDVNGGRRETLFESLGTVAAPEDSVNGEDSVRSRVSMSPSAILKRNGQGSGAESGGRALFLNLDLLGELPGEPQPSSVVCLVFAGEAVTVLESVD